MNKGPGKNQPHMHNTTNPLTGAVQKMTCSLDSVEVDSKGVSLAGKAKGMEQILSERGILAVMEAKSKLGFVAGVCKDCAMSEVKRDKARKAAKTREDEIDGSGMEGLADRSEVESEAVDLTRLRDCCMQRVLSFQADFEQRNLFYSW